MGLADRLDRAMEERELDGMDQLRVDSARKLAEWVDAHDVEAVKGPELASVIRNLFACLRDLTDGEAGEGLRDALLAGDDE